MCLQNEPKTVYTRQMSFKEMQGAVDFRLSGCEELFAARHPLWRVRFNWVCLLTSPAVVNCIKAVSGSMATFLTATLTRREIVRPRGYQLERTVGIRRIKKKKSSGGGSLVFSEMFQYNM